VQRTCKTGFPMNGIGGVWAKKSALPFEGRTHGAIRAAFLGRRVVAGEPVGTSQQWFRAGGTGYHGRGGKAAPAPR